MNVEEFATVFADGPVRSQLNWTAVQSGCQVREVFSRSRDLLGALHTVWYTGPDHRPREFAAPDAEPIQIRQALAHAPADRQDRITNLLRKFRDETQPAQLVLPGYALGGDGVLLLDGNHRAAAAYHAEVEVRLLLFVLIGPVEPAILPDLRHHRATG